MPIIVSSSRGSGGGNPTLAIVRKAAAEDVNNSLALQNDDDFSFAARANTNYLVTLNLILDGPAAADFQWDWAVPAGATGFHGGHRSTASGPDSFGDLVSNAFGTALEAELDGDGTFAYALLVAMIAVAGTAGTVQFRWAQLVATVGDTTVNAGSTMDVRTL